MSAPKFNQTKGEAIYMKPGGQGANSFLGSVDAESKTGVKESIRLLEFPIIEIENPSDITRSTSGAAGNTRLYRVEAHAIIDKGTIAGISCLTQGVYLETVTFYKMMIGGGEMKLVSETTLADVYISGMEIWHDIAFGPITSEGMFATYKFVYGKIVQIRNMYDPDDQSTGKQGFETNMSQQKTDFSGG